MAQVSDIIIYPVGFTFAAQYRHIGLWSPKATQYLFSVSRADEKIFII